MSKRLILGPLERRVLKVLWQRGSTSTVRVLQSAFPEIAYTTLMTTLDRLYRKGVLRRLPQGLAFGYEPRCTPDELLGQMLFDDVTDLSVMLPDDTALLSTFVRVVGRVDAELLDALEALVRAERTRLKGEGQ